MTTTPKREAKTPAPYLPPHWDNADAAALQALEKGEANPEQQKRAVSYIINTLAGTYDLEYRDNERDHCFASGRRFVGLQIVKLLKINLGAFIKK